MKNSVCQAGEELNNLLRKLDQVILEKALKWGRELYQRVVEHLDSWLFKVKGRGLESEHIRLVWHNTCLGQVRVKRRQYRDVRGRYRYLLDEALGTSGKGHMTMAVKELVLEMGTAMSFRRSAEVLDKASAVKVSHQTIWRLIGKVADPYLERGDQEIRHLLQMGELPEGEGQKTARLILEADGVMLSLQREHARKAEVKVGIAYEGWARVGKDRYATVNKSIYADVCGSEEYWAGMTLKLARKYDLGAMGQSIVGGDGAQWVKEGCECFGGVFQLDRYHLNRELCAALGSDRETMRAVRECCRRGEALEAWHILWQAEQKARGKQAEKIAGLRRYLVDNRLGLKDYRIVLGDEGKGLRGTGAMEGNVDKLVVRRMKNQGMSWTIKGIRRMLCVRFLWLEGKSDDLLARAVTRVSLPRTLVKRVNRVIDKARTEPHVGVLEGSLPALVGPHASRPWVHALKSLVEVHAL